MPDPTQSNGFLTQEELDLLLPGAHRVRYPAGTELVREGDASDFVLYLRRGHVKALTGDPKSIVYICKPGGIIGEIAAIRGVPRTADMVAMNEVEADLIPGDMWWEFVLTNRRVTEAVMRHLAARIIAKEIPRNESVTSSENKIAKGLLRLVDAGIGEEASDGLHISGVTQRDLGSISGLSRESASAVLGRLRADGVLTTGRGNLTIHDLKAIETLSKRDRPPLRR
ncbi:Crp/Fnr family transcriptional regulator [Glycomyces paridis]|uniref:Crp/Fnr family transcriptional regulator n=1 Tax=Glycomyces paridis TaxID=2126555 RepID=A0A4S8PAC5_9ACTN|nr:Crp/Fnr family transcriptional regulator [Glycomyces paridis]THV27228.1 Crp/Fnr family transcriptional regulator [Glycomyces paridis]